jgi:hypothetical protein
MGAGRNRTISSSVKSFPPFRLERGCIGKDHSYLPGTTSDRIRTSTSVKIMTVNKHHRGLCTSFANWRTSPIVLSVNPHNFSYL